MKENFKEQFENLRIIIKTNVSTIKNLVDQSENLTTIITTLTNQNDQNIELKSQLQLLRDQISNSIKELTEQTEKLFNTYNKLIEEVFGKQK